MTQQIMLFTQPSRVECLTWPFSQDLFDFEQRINSPRPEPLSGWSEYLLVDVLRRYTSGPRGLLVPYVSVYPHLKHVALNLNASTCGLDLLVQRELASFPRIQSLPDLCAPEI